jgi:hypothetical protein
VQQHEAQFEQSVGVWQLAQEFGEQPHVWQEDEVIPVELGKGMFTLRSRVSCIPYRVFNVLLRPSAMEHLAES